jgi:hypothetical protein
MKDLKTILTALKQTMSSKSNKKIYDKDIAAALNLKPSTLASYKRRNKPPYKAILTYCHENRLDVRKILLDDTEPIVGSSSFRHEPVFEGKIRVKYFHTLKRYADYLKIIGVTF